MSDQEYLALALAQAEESVRQGGFPAGAVLVKEDRVIATGISIGNILHNPTAHAESEAVRAACKLLSTTDLADCTLYASLQPCVMCYSAANWANVSRIVYGCYKQDSMVTKRYYEGMNQLEAINGNNTHQIELVYVPGIQDQMKSLIQRWEDTVSTES